MLPSPAKWFVILTLSVAITHCYNFAPKFSTIINAPASELGGGRFGYTVALQRRPGTRTFRLVVGAPNSGDAKYNLTTGVVFQCSLDGKSECVSLDPSGNSDKPVITLRHGAEGDDRAEEHKDNALLGAAIDVQDGPDGDLVACAPHWKIRDSVKGVAEDWNLNGICYIISGEGGTVKTLLPLGDLNKVQRKVLIKNITSTRFMHKYGEAGFSVHYAKDSAVLIGAPGVQVWRGTVIKYQDKESRAEILDPFEPKMIIKGTNEYLGYSLGSGKGPTNRNFYVSGAPRGGLLYGSVYVFDIVREEDVDQMKIFTQLNGTQFGEYFGASVCVVDVNNDDMDDLLVGAPLHELENTIHGGQNVRYDEGRVYVFINKGKEEIFMTKADFILVGSNLQGARFGTTITAIGDIDNDGFQDVAVGAPYENDGAGAIYIYHGHRLSGLEVKYSQRIEAKDINSELSGFGFSISRGLDVDENKYKDIAVGAFHSNQVVLIKSNPVLRFESSIRLLSNESRLPVNATSFHVEACLSFKAKYRVDTIDARVTMKIDPLTRFKRAKFSTSDTSFVYNVSLLWEDMNCRKLEINIVDITGRNLTKPIEIIMEYHIINKQEDPNVFCDSCHVADPHVNTFSRLLVGFSIACQGIICRPDLKVHASMRNYHQISKPLKLPLVHGSLEDRLVALAVIIDNHGEIAYPVLVNITMPKVLTIVKNDRSCVEIPGNVTDVSLYTEIICTYDFYFQKNSKIYIDIFLDVKDLDIETERLFIYVNSTSDGNETTPSDNSAVVVLPFTVEARLELVGSSGFREILDSVNSVEEDFSHSYILVNKGPSSINLLSLDLSIPVAIKINETMNTFIRVFSPKNGVKDNELETFVCKMLGDYNFTTTTPPPSTTTTPGHMVDVEPDVDEGMMVDVQRTRVKRSLNGSSTRSSLVQVLDSKLLTTEKTFVVDCFDNPENTKCVTVRCELGPFPVKRSVKIEFKMSANWSSLASIPHTNHNDIDAVYISSIASLQIRNLSNLLPEIARQNITSEAFYLLHRPVHPKPVVAAWLHGVSIAVGIFLLIIIVVIMMRVGFFRRQKKEEKALLLAEEKELEDRKRREKTQDQDQAGDRLLEEVDEGS